MRTRDRYIRATLGSLSILVLAVAWQNWSNSQQETHSADSAKPVTHHASAPTEKVVPR